MRYLTSVGCQVSGGQKVNLTLKKPADDFQDVKIIAFPATKEKTVLSSGKVVFPKTSGDATVVDFLATEDFHYEVSGYIHPLRLFRLMHIYR